jgi:hypothetical protein
LPPPYEIYPHLFVDADVIQKAYEMRMMGEWLKHYVLMLISTLERKPHSLNITTLQIVAYQAFSGVQIVPPTLEKFGLHRDNMKLNTQN